LQKNLAPGFRDAPSGGRKVAQIRRPGKKRMESMTARVEQVEKTNLGYMSAVQEVLKHKGREE